MAIGEEAFRAHLNMTSDEAAILDREVLSRLLAAAVAHTEAQLGYPLNDADEFPRGTPADVEHAVLMLAATWFEQRETLLIGVSAQPVPHGYDDVIRSHRRYTFG